MNMKKTLLSAAVVTTFTASAGTALAQQQGQLRLITAGELIGLEIETNDDREAGEIESLLIEPTSGDVRYVLLSEDGDLDIAYDELIALPFNMLDLYSVDDDEILANVSFSRISGATRLTEDSIADLAEPRMITQLYDYYSLPEEGQADSASMASNSGANGAASARSAAKTGKDAKSNQPDEASNKSAKMQQASDSNGDGGSKGTPHIRVTRYAVTTLVPGIKPTDRLLGAEVHAANHDEELGEIDEIVLDMDHGKVAYTLVSSGGFLGIGDEWSALPLQRLSWNADKEVYVIDVDENSNRKFTKLARSSVPSSVSVSDLNEFYDYFGMGEYSAMK